MTMIMGSWEREVHGVCRRSISGQSVGRGGGQMDSGRLGRRGLVGREGPGSSL